MFFIAFYKKYGILRLYLLHKVKKMGKQNIKHNCIANLFKTKTESTKNEKPLTSAERTLLRELDDDTVKLIATKAEYDEYINHGYINHNFYKKYEQSIKMVLGELMEVPLIENDKEIVENNCCCM